MATLNKQQLEAVHTTEGQLLILAGAGSGKTTVLVERITEMLKNGVPAEHILTLTFTNKAANELKERISKKLGEDIVRTMWSSNFHSLCVRILRRNAKYSSKIKSNHFTIVDNEESVKLIKSIVQDMGLDPKEVSPKNIYYAISMLKNEMVDAKSYAEQKPANRYVDWKKATEMMNQLVREEDRLMFRAAFEEYQERLYEMDGVDFDDLILYTIDLFLTNPDILERYQEQFHYIMVDEFQDTNLAQYALIQLLAGKHHNLAVVGDDAQSIYKFRGADIRNILHFQKTYPEAKIISLEQNYRSTDVILQAANQIISHNKDQHSKNLFTEHKGGEGITSELLYNEYEEAEFVADEIEKRIRRGYKYGDIAILSRTNSQTRPFEQAFIQRGIAYQVVGGLRFFDRKEIKDMTAYIRFVLNPNDSLAFERIVNFPKRGIGKTTVERLLDATKERSLEEVLDDLDSIKLTKNARNGLEHMLTVIRNTREKLHTWNADVVLTYLIEELQIKEEFDREKDERKGERKQNLSQLVNMAADMVYTGKGKTLEEFADMVSLYSDQDSIDDEKQDSVKMMTIHASKGLEFPVVFVVGLEEGMFPHDRSIQENDIEEERRLMYVAVTRAKDKLYLTNVQTRRVFGQTEVMEPSRFLEEFDISLLF